MSSSDDIRQVAKELADELKRPKIRGAVGGLASPDAPWIKSPELSKLAAMYKSAESNTHSIWAAKRTGIQSEFYQKYKEAEASGDHDSSIYYRARLGIGIRKRRSGEAHRIVELHRDKIARETAATERKRSDALALRRYERGRKAGLKAEFDRLKWAGNYEEAADILAELRGINYTDRDEFKKQWAGRQWEKAEELSKRMSDKSHRVQSKKEAANIRREELEKRRAATAAERAYQQQNRDENFAARQDALDERDRIRNRKAENREMVRDAQRRRKENERRDRESKKLEDRKHRDSVKSTKAMFRLTRRLAMFAGGFGFGVHIARAIGDRVLGGSYDASGQVIKNTNFTRYRGITSRDASAISRIAAKNGLDDGAIKSFIGNLSSQLAMSNLQMTDLVKNLAYWNIDHTDKNGNMADVMTLLRRMGQKSSRLSGVEKQQFMSMFGIDENMMSLIESVKNGTGNIKGFDDLWGNSQVASEYAKYMQNFVDYNEKFKNQLYMKGGFWNRFRATGIGLAQAIGMDKWKASLTFDKNKLNKGYEAVAGQTQITQASGFGTSGKKEITVNLGGQEFYFTGNTTKEIMQEVKEKMMPAIAQSIVDQLQIYEGD